MANSSLSLSYRLFHPLCLPHFLSSISSCLSYCRGHIPFPHHSHLFLFLFFPSSPAVPSNSPFPPYYLLWSISFSPPLVIALFTLIHLLYISPRYQYYEILISQSSFPIIISPYFFFLFFFSLDLSHLFLPSAFTHVDSHL